MIKCTFTPKSFEQKMAEKAFSIFEADLSDVDARNELYKSIKDVSESMGLTGPVKIEQAVQIVENLLSDYFDEAQQLDSNEIRTAISEWKRIPEPEDITADHLIKDNEKIERFNDDPFESNYGAATYAKIRAKQQANNIGVKSILYDESGIINSVSDLNNSIKQQQELLLQKVIDYLKTRISPENQAKYPEIFQNGRMYNGENYTGIVEKIADLYSSILGKQNFDTRTLNKYYKDKNYNILDAYNSWIILNNFDIILQKQFGKAISINPDMAKFTGKNKYSIAGGSNVYTTWRTNEEIDLAKEINNITQSIITSIPLVRKSGTSSSDEYIKFNEFLYIIGKIKDLVYSAKNDWDITFNIQDETFSEEFKQKYNGKSFLNLVNSIRSNPQTILPDLFKLLNNDNIINQLIQNKVIDENTFLNIDLDIINSLYQGLFNLDNPNSLFSIQAKSGFENNNYFAFIGQTIDSTFKASFLQYFRDPQGNVYVRNMYDQSINNIEFALRDNINAINSQMLTQNYDSIKDKYQITQITRTLHGDGDYNIVYNGQEYTFTIKNRQITGVNNTLNQYVGDTQLLYKLAEEYQKIPESIQFTIKDFHKGPLKVNVSLLKGDITYEINGQPFQFNSIKDYQSLANIIQDVLRQNFTIDEKYFNAYRNKFGLGSGGVITTNLMQLVSRVIANQHISNSLKGKTPVEIKNQLNTIFGKERSPIKPVFDNKLGEIKLLTEADTRIMLDLAEVKAQINGRLTSSQILDSEGNALASSGLSRLLSSLSYQIQQQVKTDQAAAREFSLWNTGIFKGIQQMKEMQDNVEDSSKSSTEFSSSEMEFGTVFVDFIQSLFNQGNSKTPLKNGITAFIPSENSDKTYIGRMLIDLSKIQIGEATLFDIIRTNPSETVRAMLPLMQKELGSFYRKALDNINQEWNRVGELIGQPISYGNWGYLDIQALKEGKSTLQYINDLITKYNNENPQNPIILIDQVHYVANKNGSLSTNLSFTENLNRFNDIENLSEFLYQQNVELVKELLKDRLDIPSELVPEIKTKFPEWIDSRTGKVILAKVYDYNPSTGEEEFAGDIRKHSDLQYLEEVSDSVSRIEINPIIESYNTLNYFFTQEFMGSTVGMFYAHPSKDKSGNPLMDEKSRKLAQDKRNVSFTASMHSFLLNLIQGIPQEINIAIMPDVKDSFQTISGDQFIGDIKAFDGATFENPFFGILENYSLRGAKVGINKKTFTHYYDERTGTGGIIKTANFSLTNEGIRRSKFYQRMIRNMSDRIWRKQDETPFIIPQDSYKDWDETRTQAVTYVQSNNLVDYNGNVISFTNPTDIQGNLYFKSVDNEGNVHYYKINSIEYLGKNQFDRHLQEVDEQGRIISDNEIVENVLVNSNYKLWNLFGGAYAMEMQAGNRTLQFTENSIKLVADISNKIGTKINDIVRTQEDVYQPLKHSDIHIMPTIGAVKQGAGNINGDSAYTTSDPNFINFMKVKMNQSGIQLDKEHHADNEDLSIMTQVISACAARGYTQEQSQDMYNALAALARSGIREYLNAFDEFFTNPSGTSTDIKGNEISTNQKYQQVILDTLVDALVNSTNNEGTIQIVAQELINKAKEGKEIAFKDMDIIPYSDPSIFRKLHSTIAVALTRGAIKIKVSGVLSVLCPSYNIVKIYGNKTLSSFNSDKEIEKLQERYDTVNLINNLSQIKTGRTYRVEDSSGNIQYIPITISASYYSLKDKFGNNFVDPTLSELEYIEGATSFNGIPLQYGPIATRAGRKVAARATTVNGIKIIQIDREAFKEKWNEKAWKKPLRSDFIGIVDFQSENDLITWNLLHELAHHKFDDNQHQDFDTNFKENRANSYATQNFRQIRPQYQILKLVEQIAPTEGFDGGRELGSYNATFRAIGSTQTFNIYDLESVKRLSDLKSQKASSELIDQALKDVQKDLNILTGLDNPILPQKRMDKDIFNQSTTETISENTLTLYDGTIIELDKSSINIEPYEIIMPKIFASKFGLETSDDLNVIKNNKNFFVERLLDRIKPRGISNSVYSIGLMNISGRHMYVLDRSQPVPNLENFKQKEISIFKEKGKIWRIQNGEKVYQMNKGDTVWEYSSPDGTIQEVIVTNNIESYLKNNKFITINISEKADKAKLINVLSLSRKNNRAINSYMEALDIAYQAYGDSYEQAIENIQNTGMNDLEESPIGDYFLKLGHQLHTSFLKSLEVVAARIPAQSMQSFMPMKVVAFEGADINTAYVSTAQLLFQGSDYDIDSVSLASYSFDKSGRYVLHSPYANTETIENLQASEKIPFPTGIQLEINNKSTLNYSKLVSIGSIDPTKPFAVIQGRNGTEFRLNLNSPETIDLFARFVKYCNNIGYIPNASEQRFQSIANQLKDIINEHNDYINNNSAEDFSKNYVVSTMYKIGISPANLIESQQAMDTITGPLKKVANSTIKAEDSSLENPGMFTTNIHGIVQNMDGKKGVGICAVGLKSFFALTARYNEALKNGNIHEQERLKSDVTIAGKHFQMLANAYGTNIANQAVADIIHSLSNQDQALTLSAILSLATDNAKELALTKLNAANFLGMYIYGITIGVDFKTLADIICSRTGLIINEMMGSNSFTKKRGMNIQNIFDYLETAPELKAELPTGTKLSSIGQMIMDKLSQQELFNLANSRISLSEKFNILNQIKQQIDREILTEQEKQALHRVVEEAENYIERVEVINSEPEIYQDFKKLNEGGDELRRQGQLLHINQGLETSYAKSINYIDTLTSTIADRRYSMYREEKRQFDRKILLGQEEEKNAPKSPDKRWKFDFHKFIFDKNYREAWIDIYDGKINHDLFINNKTYREQFNRIFDNIKNLKNPEVAYNSVLAKLTPSKVFFNILDTMQVPHFAAYLQSADMLHQAMLKTSVKYRTIYDLGKKAINNLGAFSTTDKENIYRRTEQFVDRLLRDRYLLSEGIKVSIPRGSDYFVEKSDRLSKKTSNSSDSTIQLGTKAGNASFKMLMETKIIPDLQSGKYGEGNSQEPALMHNEFIKSLAPLLYKQNPQYNVTIDYAPNINMSPRSDSEKAQFERIKFAFNEFTHGKLGNIKYKLGDKYWSIPELFYYYNLITFGGRPGENTLTSIFQDVLNISPIKKIRDFINQFDKEGVLDVNIDSLVKEVALRQNPWSSHLKYIYYEDPNTGKLSYWQKLYDTRDENGDYIYNINGYTPIGTINIKEDLKNFVLNAEKSDISEKEIKLSNKDSVILKFNQGQVSSITLRPWTGSFVDILHGKNIQIPKQYKEFFDNPPTKYIIGEDGSRELGYDLDAIKKYVEQLITCS